MRADVRDTYNSLSIRDSPSSLGTTLNFHSLFFLPYFLTFLTYSNMSFKWLCFKNMFSDVPLNIYLRIHVICHSYKTSIRYRNKFIPQGEMRIGSNGDTFVCVCAAFQRTSNTMLNMHNGSSVNASHARYGMYNAR